MWEIGVYALIPQRTINILCIATYAHAWRFTAKPVAKHFLGVSSLDLGRAYTAALFLARLCPIAVTQRALHEDAVDPSIELAADAPKRAGADETRAFVQAD